MPSQISIPTSQIQEARQAFEAYAEFLRRKTTPPHLDLTPVESGPFPSGNYIWSRVPDDVLPYLDHQAIRYNVLDGEP